ncbi:hypothetical protein GCM10020221_03380 [Streptomyces thioluteus]|uniref:Radical SAM core domain-containing protein n=1 Tax=Streptomyces thioluteus TaxID=66431 RepID=A0ABP6IVI4_STRTU
MPNARRMLCVSPRYARSFGTFDHASRLIGTRAFMPPQGILVIAAWFSARGWDVRVVDENVRPLTERDPDRADVVLVSGMHVQHAHIQAVVSVARRRGLLTVLGGPSVSACSHWYPEPDILHLGELGDATEALADRLARDLGRPARQEVYRTVNRLPLEDFPVPAFHLIDVSEYLSGTVQFSSGCPFRCDFCDIPELYGRNPRLKTPRRITEELDALVAGGVRNVVYFVDDNFIGNPHAARSLLEELVRWQRRHDYPVDFSCEATLNITKRPELLSLMREARFTKVFVGVETPEENALRAIGKTQNLRSPLLDAIAEINAHGIEVVSGIILGLDTDEPGTYERSSASSTPAASLC